MEILEKNLQMVIAYLELCIFTGKASKIFLELNGYHIMFDEAMKNAKFSALKTYFK